jgi:hypothetical protein
MRNRGAEAMFELMRLSVVGARWAVDGRCVRGGGIGGEGRATVAGERGSGRL